MAWERRKGGSRYYTRSKRVAGRVVREYVGSGLVGALAAEYDRRARVQAEKKVALWTALRRRLKSADDAAGDFFATAEALTRSALHLVGFHQHHRGEWRMRRGGEEPGVVESGPESEIVRQRPAQTRAVRRRGRSLGTPTGLCTQTRTLDPSGGPRRAGRRIAELRDELAGTEPTVLEQLIIDRVIVSWVQDAGSVLLSASKRQPRAVG
jgi:hypothetical protein